MTTTPDGGDFGQDDFGQDQDIDLGIDPGIDRFIDLGIDLFNRARFFDAHEVLEQVWRFLPGDRPSARHLRRHIHRLHVQGMVQLAVAFHHQSTGNIVGARSVLERALRNLEGANPSCPDLDLDRLRLELADWRLYLDDSAGPRKLDGQDVGHRAAPALPNIVRRR
jgi:hypothetical protein